MIQFARCWIKRRAAARQKIPFCSTKPPISPPAEALLTNKAGSKLKFWRVPISALDLLMTHHQLGDVILQNNGGVVLRDRAFVGGAEIPCIHFGGLVGHRAPGANQLLRIDMPDGEAAFFCFQGGVWYRFIPMMHIPNALVYSLKETMRQHGVLSPLVWLRQMFSGAVFLVCVATMCGLFFIIFFWKI